MQRTSNTKRTTVLTKWYPRVRSQHPTHDWLRDNLPLFPFRSIIRLGSTTTTRNAFPKRTLEELTRIKEINTVESVKNSANKLLMKQCFTKAQVVTANWFIYINDAFFRGIENVPLNKIDLPYPIVAKHIYGSRGTGNYKLDNQEQLDQWLQGKTLSNYIFERFYTYSREYRLHVSKNGCFYTCRKMLKSDTPEANRWYRNDSNSNWILEENEAFDKPVNWNSIVEECVKALKSVGLDIGGFDVKVQSSTKTNGRVRENPEFIIIESNSACSFGEVTKDKYKQELINLLNG